MRDEKTALIDAVKAPFADRLLQNVAALCDPSRVDYVVCNHAELDHAGALPQVLKAMPQATLLCDKKCAATLGEHFDTSAWKIRTVASGEEISLGRRTLRFLETPMVHWPESMATYVPEEKLLFSMDAFGQHYATSERFEDEVDPDVVMQEAKTYYANIVMPYGKAVLKTLDAARRPADHDDCPEPRADLAAESGGDDSSGLSQLGQPSAATEGAGHLRQHVGEHRGDGPGDSRRRRRSRASAPRSSRSADQI